jgi:hypothetical protein
MTTIHSDKVLREAMKQLGFDRHEISDRMEQYKSLNGWKPITIKELSKMTDEEKSKLKSYCWKNGNPRCDSVGITDVKITPSDRPGCFDVSWSDSDGDPNIYGYEESQKIDQIGDGTWDYGLYKRVKK